MAVRLEKIASEVTDEQSEIAAYKIVAFPTDYTLEILYQKSKGGNITVPRFQRQYVWTVSQASRLIESFLLGLPVPGIFFYKEKETAKLVVIDGQQRLRSVFSFFDGEMPDTKHPFRLRDVQPKWEGKLYTELTKVEQQILKDSVLRATIIDQLDPKDDSSIFHIFERLNTGGTSLRPQEVRNCIYSGPFNDLLIELNRGKEWRRIVGSEQIDKRMRDVELILRFLALAYDADRYYKPMKNFLSDFTKVHRHPNRSKLSEFDNSFTGTVHRVVSSLGRKPFHIRIGLNAAVYDSVMVAFAWAKRDVPANVKSRYRDLLNDETYQAFFSSSTTDVEVVRKRIQIARRKLFGG